MTLPDGQHQDILANVILPAWTTNAVAQEQPVVVLVAGPPGSGKSTLCTLLKAVLDQRGGAVLIDRDVYKAAHPRYAGLLRSDDRTAGVRVRSDVLRWQAEVEEHVRARRFDAVLETPDPAAAPAAARAFRDSGFRVEVVVLAAAEAVTQLSALDRYLTQVRETGAGRYVSVDNHDRCTRGLVPALAVIEAERLADRMMVIRRDMTVLYDNELPAAGSWRRPVGADRTLMAERARPWTAPETSCFRRELASTEQQLHPAVIAPERRLAVAGGLERAAALAEPVRRVAQVRSAPPGVDYHRLSAGEHRWIFDEMIVPQYLSRVVAQEQPVATFVMAQPGSGKTLATKMIRRALRHRRPVRISGENFKGHHPDYIKLLNCDPRIAGATVRADYRAWIEQAEEYVRLRRGDMVIEIAPGDVGGFLERARRNHAAGYRNELVLLGVREADSRQGAAHRYARLHGDGLPARFTTRAGHDQSFKAVADCARIAEADPAISSVLVMRRDGHALFHNQRVSGGEFGLAPRALPVLTAERLRPYTEQEARQFLTLQGWLHAVLPQYRDELAEITALARPLMPLGLQPPRLTSPASDPGHLPLPAQEPVPELVRAAV
ncbi:zeta toxin family protein [Streptomyces sp. NBC_01304]|uniref:zeta toxin family protein n=1 Tax=Streptomyces sp. NBC_01304 TaxID=2903818 RepID=UPI002E115B81|nr:zeta toxin family protein [Streptomyces sp. NBC_01304]